MIQNNISHQMLIADVNLFKVLIQLLLIQKMKGNQLIHLNSLKRQKPKLKLYSGRIINVRIMMMTSVVLIVELEAAYSHGR